MSAHYIPTLDGWRAIAILGVLVCHATASHFDETFWSNHPLLFLWTQRGALGVNLFFGISGFLICSKLLEERKTLGKFSIFAFYIRRIFRILPPFLCCIAVTTFLFYIGFIPASPKELWSSLFFYRNYVSMNDLGSGWYTGHFWSLCIEEHFYLIWPVLLTVFLKRNVAFLTASFAFLVASWRYIDFHYNIIGNQALHLPRTDLKLDGLIWGCFMAVLLDNDKIREKLLQLLQPWVWAVLVFAFISMTHWNPPLTHFFQPVLIPLIIAGTVLHHSSMAGRFLEFSMIRWIGRLSYGLYLWNNLFLPPMALYGKYPLNLAQVFPFNILMIFLVTCLSFYLLEKPLIRLGYLIAAGRSSGYF